MNPHTGATGGAQGMGAAEEDQGRPPRRGSGELSRLVLEVLRQAGEALTASQVMGFLDNSGGPLAYTTVVTTLSRMHEQGIVDRFKTGRAYAYQAVTDQALLAARRMRRVLDAEDDRMAVLAQFVSDLDPRDEQVVRDLLGFGAASSLEPPGDHRRRSPR